MRTISPGELTPGELFDGADGFLVYFDETDTETERVIRLSRIRPFIEPSD